MIQNLSKLPLSIPCFVLFNVVCNVIHRNNLLLLIICQTLELDVLLLGIVVEMCILVVSVREDFGALKGHTLVVNKALYGLKSSALRWRERLLDALKEMGFKPTLAEADIWMRECGDHYEYISVYVDNLLVISRRPQTIIDQLKDDYKFKLKGTGPISFYLGCNFMRDDEGNLCYQHRQYIKKMLDNYKKRNPPRPYHHWSRIIIIPNWMIRNYWISKESRSTSH